MRDREIESTLSGTGSFPLSMNQASSESVGSCRLDRRSLTAEREHIPTGWIFLSFVLTEIFVNFDGGAIPALLDSVASTFHLGKSEQGFLGGLPYVGLVMASLVAGHGLSSKRCSPKWIIFISMLGSAVCGLAVAVLTSKFGLFAVRLGAGLTQSSFVIYIPVWVDEFAPKSSVTTWMAAIQAGVALGVMVGYGVAACFADMKDLWRMTFVVQGCALVFTVLIIGCFPRSWIDVGHTQADIMGRKSRKISREESGGVGSFPVVPMAANAFSTCSWIEEGIEEDGFLSTVAEEEEPPLDAGAFDDRYTTPGLPLAASPGGASPGGPTPSHRRVRSIMSVTSEQQSTWTKCRMLLSNQLFVAIVVALCGLFFVVTGVEFWATEYLNKVYSMSLMRVVHHHSILDHAGIVGEYRKEDFTSYQNANVFAKADALLFFEDDYWKIAPVHNAPSATLPLPSGTNYTITGRGNCLRPEFAQWPSGYSVEAVVNQNLIFVCFAVVAATGPTLGVFFGGAVIDRAGGYKGHANLVRSLKICTVFGALATSAGLICAVVDDYWPIVFGLWIVLFFGGAILPPATGILIAIVDSEMRTFANALSMFCYNVFGYALGSILPGLFMDWITPAGDSSQFSAVYIDQWGMRLILGWALFGFTGMLWAWLSAKSNPDFGDKTASFATSLQ